VLVLSPTRSNPRYFFVHHAAKANFYRYEEGAKNTEIILKTSVFFAPTPFFVLLPTRFYPVT
jgi:hypothetical protein